MKIIKNEQLISRNARIASITMIGSLLILGGGMFLSFQYPEQPMISLAALAAGFLLAQIGIYFTNRWGRKPRPDQLLDQGLKGLDKKYYLYHYSAPVAHLLVGPAGVWVLHPYYQQGEITYSKGRWRQKGGNLFLKIFAQENLGRPDYEVQGDYKTLLSYLEENLPEGDVPPIKSVLVFTNPETKVNIPDSESPPAKTVSIKKLKDTIRKAVKEQSLSYERVEQITEILGGE